MMLLTDEILAERWKMMFKAPKNIKMLTALQYVREALKERILPKGELIIDTAEGLLCLVDGVRVFDMVAHLAKYKLSFTAYRALFDLPTSTPWLSKAYLKAYQAKAFEGREMPRFAVKVEDSFTWNEVVNMLDGTSRPIMKRYVATRQGLSWEQYLETCGLPPEYPSNAISYTLEKSAFASRQIDEDSPAPSARRTA